MELGELLKQRAWYQKHFKLHYYEPYEYQKKFHHAYGYKSETLATDRGLVCANKIGKCALVQSKILTESGEKRIGDIFGTQCNVMAWDGERQVARRVLAWVQKPPQECYRFTMSDGRRFECAAGHLILSADGYREASTFSHSPLGSMQGSSRLVRDGDDLHWSEIARGWLCRYLMDFRRYGAQLLYESDNALVFAPLPADALKRSVRLWRMGDLACKLVNTLCGWSDRLSTLGAALRSLVPFGPSLAQDSGSSGLSFQGDSRASRPFLQTSDRPRAENEQRHHQKESSLALWGIPNVEGNSIVAVDYIGIHPVYDLQVEGLENYCGAGLVHHNTYCAAMEVAMHATGDYPPWWEGHRFSHRVEILCGSESNELTRDILQKELFGDPEDKDSTGKGTIPLANIGKVTRKAGVPNAFDSVLVKHKKGGWSRIFFRAYEQGPKKHMGFPIHVGWMDEEPPRDIKSQYKRATLNTRGILLATFTPESGMTEVCNEYFNHRKIGMGLIQATWDDCPLFDDPKYKAEVLDQFPEHEREMRSKGIPQMGSGLIFTTPEEELMVPPFEIPKHWSRIKGIDFGIDHPFAGVAIAFDPDTETAYLYWSHRKTRQTIADHAAAINSFDSWIPVIWPHDGLKQDAQSGKPLADIYRDDPYHVEMLPQCFSNPAPPGKKEGQGGQGVEVGLLALDEAMKNGKFKVFANQSDWFEEKRTYHRKDGLVFKERDDLMSATRYAYMSRRFAITQPIQVKRAVSVRGMRNW